MASFNNHLHIFPFVKTISHHRKESGYSAGSDQHTVHSDEHSNNRNYSLVALHEAKKYIEELNILVATFRQFIIYIGQPSDDSGMRHHIGALRHKALQVAALCKEYIAPGVRSTSLPNHIADHYRRMATQFIGCLQLFENELLKFQRLLILFPKDNYYPKTATSFFRLATGERRRCHKQASRTLVTRSPPSAPRLPHQPCLRSTIKPDTFSELTTCHQPSSDLILNHISPIKEQPLQEMYIDHQLSNASSNCYHECSNESNINLPNESTVNPSNLLLSENPTVNDVNENVISSSSLKYPDFPLDEEEETAEDEEVAQVFKNSVYEKTETLLPSIQPQQMCLVNASSTNSCNRDLQNLHRELWDVCNNLTEVRSIMGDIRDFPRTKTPDEMLFRQHFAKKLLASQKRLKYPSCRSGLCRCCLR